MSDEAELISQTVHVLEGMSIPYMIGGSVALSVWATPRLTHDLDLVLDLPEDRIQEFCEHFSPDRYFLDPDSMRSAFQQRGQPSLGMYSFIDMNTGLKADLFPLRPNDIAQQAALKRRITTEVLEGLRAAVYAPDDLLVQKLRWYAAGESERQFRDCLNLALTDLERPEPMIAWEYVDGWADRLGPTIQRAWARVKEAVSQGERTGSC